MMGYQTLQITVLDDRFGTETEHDLAVEVYCTPAEPATSDCPGCSDEWEVVSVCVAGDNEEIIRYLGEDEMVLLNAAVDAEMERLRQ